ncbi:MAG: hypothetical protein J1E60_04155 [Christensenellaceae bacterium]|nr:hypothetical protein [Christensenellaceae bacterium]
MSDDYDPDDPLTWGGIEWTHSNGGYRVEHIYWNDFALYGELNLSDCTQLVGLFCEDNFLTAIDVSHNTELKSLEFACNRLTEIDVSNNLNLKTLTCYYNRLTALDVTANTQLEHLSCSLNELTGLDVSNNIYLEHLSFDENQISEINLSNNPALEELFCYKNQLTGLDLSNNTLLMNFSCWGNLLTELDLRNCPNLLADSIVAEGNGFIGCSFYYDYDTYLVSPTLGENGSFLGWYDTDGNLLSTDWSFDILDCPVTDFVAKFTSNGDAPQNDGDVDGDGVATIADAILVARNVLGLMELSETQIIHGDIDGNGETSVADAILIARMALGVI